MDNYGAAVQVSHEPVASERRHDPDVRRRMSGPAMRTFLNIAQAWKLTVDEQRGLLGWPATSTFHKYKAGDVGLLTYDMLTRISLVIGIYKALQILLPKPESADAWVRKPNQFFNGRPALERMLGGNVADLYEVRKYLDFASGNDL